MIGAERFYSLLKEKDIDFFTGVPDSLLKDFCAYITDNVDSHRNIIAANEGNAVALAVGHYLATKKIGLVYMQNSGIGNAINPLLSLVDPLVYSIPLLLLIGWRGEPGKKDEPQHLKQGQVTLQLLDTMGIKYEILSSDEDKVRKSIENAMEYMVKNKSPYALIVPKGIFSKYELKNMIKTNYELSREEALEKIVLGLKDNDIIVSTTGKASRELFELREKYGQSHEKDFLTVGSMGHSLSIAMGIALEHPDKTVYCIDGDGSLLMHMGGLAIAGSMSPKNLKHIVINNGSHDSVGGQPTVGFDIDMQQIAKGTGYKLILKAETEEDLLQSMVKINNTPELTFLEVMVNKGSREDLGRPTTTPIENKDEFMKYISKNN